jgi:hypothetical protein
MVSLAAVSAIRDPTGVDLNVRDAGAKPTQRSATQVRTDERFRLHTPDFARQTGSAIDLFSIARRHCALTNFGWKS